MIHICFQLSLVHKGLFLISCRFFNQSYKDYSNYISKNTYLIIDSTICLGFLIFVWVIFRLILTVTHRLNYLNWQASWCDCLNHLHILNIIHISKPYFLDQWMINKIINVWKLARKFLNENVRWWKLFKI